VQTPLKETLQKETPLEETTVKKTPLKEMLSIEKIKTTPYKNQWEVTPQVISMLCQYCKGDSQQPKIIFIH